MLSADGSQGKAEVERMRRGRHTRRYLYAEKTQVAPCGAVANIRACSAGNLRSCVLSVCAGGAKLRRGRFVFFSSTKFKLS